ncbi:hypothetical protein [Mycolicibacterium sp. GESEQ-9]|uniref:hypothetical protein n=1 Tax=Mycolicibacterium sp. GESEQ-9 TaxID=2812656 RepID=UPI001B3321F9|nr:hypothetical protein [Mycolicibacterium sp. GESEQ-9]
MAAPASVDESAVGAAGPTPLFSDAPSAVAMPVPPATAAPMPKATAKKPTRPTYAAAPAADSPVEGRCCAAMYEALCRPMVIPIVPRRTDVLPAVVG